MNIHIYTYMYAFAFFRFSQTDHAGVTEREIHRAFLTMEREETEL